VDRVAGGGGAADAAALVDDQGLGAAGADINAEEAAGHEELRPTSMRMDAIMHAIRGSAMGRTSTTPVAAAVTGSATACSSIRATLSYE
jgi:hypothetical protein